MNLPVPNADEVRRFAELYRERFGIVLGEAEALDTLAHLAALVYATRYLDAGSVVATPTSPST
jgi:hypothetical protein